MRKWTKEIFLGVRVLVSLYFLVLSMNLEPYNRGIVITLIIAYFSASLAIYSLFNRLKILNKLLEPVLLPIVSFASESPASVYGLIPAIVLHASRNFGTSLFILASSVLILSYFYIDNLKNLSLGIVLMISIFLGSLMLDITESIRKERERVVKLKSLYRRLLKDFARWERERRDLELTKFLLNASLESHSVEDFLKKVKKKFGLRSVRIIPKASLENYEILMDREKGLLSVPVKLEEGNAVVIFELESPFQLNDELIVNTLTRAGRMISLYIAGFTDTSGVGKAISVS